MQGMKLDNRSGPAMSFCPKYSCRKKGTTVAVVGVHRTIGGWLRVSGMCLEIDIVWIVHSG